MSNPTQAITKNSRPPVAALVLTASIIAVGTVLYLTVNWGAEEVDSIVNQGANQLEDISIPSSNLEKSTSPTVLSEQVSSEQVEILSSEKENSLPSLVAPLQKNNSANNLVKFDDAQAETQPLTAEQREDLAQQVQKTNEEVAELVQEFDDNLYDKERKAQLAQEFVAKTQRYNQMVLEIVKSDLINSSNEEQKGAAVE